MKGYNNKIVPVKVRSVNIGTGVPKICAPFTGDAEDEIIKRAEKVVQSGPDLAEWRADGFEGAKDRSRTEKLLRKLRRILGGLPLIVTCRSEKEGGRGAFSFEEYLDFIINAAVSGFADIVDVEFSAGEAAANAVLKASRASGVKVIISSHDFSGTPQKEEIVTKLRGMQELGADMPKMAVMPKSPADVLTLLEATAEMYVRYAKRPLITVSMSNLGRLSRVCGEVFGSSLTFASGTEETAPGQLSVSVLRKALPLFHIGIESR